MYNQAEHSKSWHDRATAYKHRDKRNRYNAFIDILRDEFKQQLAARFFTIKRLAREKQHWFAHSMFPSVIQCAASPDNLPRS